MSYAGFEIGDTVELPNTGRRFGVVDFSQGLVILESERGERLKAGIKAIRKVMVHTPQGEGCEKCRSASLE